MRLRMAASTGWIGIAAVLLSLTGCATKQPPRPLPAPPPPAPQPPPVDTAEIERLYAELSWAEGRFAAGLELLEGGDEVEAERLFREAQQGLRNGAGRCVETRGCELDRYLDGLERVLGAHEIALKRQAYRIETLEASVEEDPEREPGTSSLVTDLTEPTVASTLLRGTELSEVIQLNGPVRAALDDWLTWMRPMLVSSWVNYQFLREEIAPIYAEGDLPEALLFAIMATESRGKVHSTSRAGASGPLQFMRHTGRMYGLHVENGFDLRFDPVAATRANVAFLGDLFESLDGSLEMALGAYNGGQTRMRNLMRRHRTGFWDSRIYYSLPSETREYVPRVLAAALLFLHPERFNLRFPELDTTREILELRRESSLGELAICLGQEKNPHGWFRTIRNLNPRLKPGDRIEQGTAIRLPAMLLPTYEEQCLEGPVVETASELFHANYPEEPEIVPYVVRRGDTLGRIAARYRCTSLRELAALNNLRAPRYVIQVGQRLKVPTCS